MTRPRIPLCVPSVGPLEEAAVLAAMRSGWVAPAGPQLREFEDALARLTGREHIVAVSSGTAALHLALLAAGIEAGDRVAVATLTFAATANAVKYVGAEPVFIDCDRDGLMDPEILETALADHAGSRRPIRAVIPVDLYGRPAYYPRLTALADRYGAIIVADAAESLGASLHDMPAGGFGQFAALSFNGNKIVTTSTGGAVLCPDATAAQRVHYLATQAKRAVAHYEHTETGYNYRLSNILAALGTAQLSRLERIVAAKRATHRDYLRLSGEQRSLLEPGDGNCWMNVLLLASGTRPSPVGLAAALHERGIETRPVFKPMHLQPVHRGTDLRYITGRAERLYRTGICLPSSTDLSQGERARVISAVLQETDPAQIHSSAENGLAANGQARGGRDTSGS